MSTIVRTTKVLSFANSGKDKKLVEFLTIYKQAVNYYIDIFWSSRYRLPKFVSKIDIQKDISKLSARVKQCAGNQALGMIRAIVKKKVCLSQSKPILEQLTATLNSNCISFIDSNNSFDLWLKIDSLGIFGRNKPIYIPIKGHRHINSLLQQDFNLAKDITLRVNNLGKLECLLFLKKDIITKVNGSTLGIDLGVKKLLSTSKNQFLGTKIETLIKKINNKQTNSKAYKRAIIETKEYVNKTIKQLDLTSVKSIVIEDLRKIKHTNSRKQKLTKSFKRIIHHWPCGQTINKLKEICELLGVQVITVNLYNTSITCSNCGNVNKKDRQGEVFKCSLCNSVVDSDFNASLNILLRGLSQPNMVGCKSL